MEYIDGICYINLKHRMDRNISIQTNLKAHGFDMNKVHRIDGILCEGCGHLGCAQSHVKAIKTAIENDWDYVMILEDDFTFRINKEELIEKLNRIKSIEWDVLMLVALRKNIEKSDHGFLVKVVGCTGAAAYIVRKHYYQTLLQNFEESVELVKKELEVHINKCKENNSLIVKLNDCSTVDQNWSKLQCRDTFYLCDPPLGNQDFGYSDNNCSIEHQRYILSKSSC